MIELNVVLTQINTNLFDIRILASELQRFYDTNGSLCHIKLTKPQNKGTEAQNKTIHALMTALFLSGMHSYNAKSGADFKDMLKADFGVFKVIDHKGETFKILKSWSQYSKEERSRFIDAVVSLCHQCGAYIDDDRVREIIDGAELKK